MDGHEATRRIRAASCRKRSAIPIIAFTANALKGEKELCFESGMNHYLAKPVPPHELQTVMSSFLSKTY